MKLRLLLLFFADIIFFRLFPKLAQDSMKPLIKELRNTFKKKYLSVSVLFQTVADFQLREIFRVITISI